MRLPPLRHLPNAALARIGYRLVPKAPLASDSRYALEPELEYVLAHYLGVRTEPSPFMLVEVGAYDGTSFDRLHRHIHAHGWHGVLVEPQERHFLRLLDAYRDCPGITCVNAAVDRESGTRLLYSIADGHGEPIDSLGGLASFSRQRLVEWQHKDGHKYPLAQQIVAEPVRCVTFDEILADVAHLDLLYIDAEGYDFELLRVFDLERFAPAIVRFEHVHLSRGDWDDAVRLLGRHGYRVMGEEYDTTAYRPPEV